MTAPDRKLSHLDADGRPRMVDVSAKPETAREATAKGSVYMSAETLALIVSGSAAEGRRADDGADRGDYGGEADA